MDLDKATDLARETDYADAATHTDVNPINWADAGAFFLEGYEYAKNETVARLQDPNTVYINMLRGTIATLSEDQINRLLQVQAEIETP